MMHLKTLILSAYVRQKYNLVLLTCLLFLNLDGTIANKCCISPDEYANITLATPPSFPLRALSPNLWIPH